MTPKDNLGHNEKKLLLANSYYFFELNSKVIKECY